MTSNAETRLPSARMHSSALVFCYTLVSSASFLAMSCNLFAAEPYMVAPFGGQGGPHSLPCILRLRIKYMTKGTSLCTMIDGIICPLVRANWNQPSVAIPCGLVVAADRQQGHARIRARPVLGRPTRGLSYAIGGGNDIGSRTALYGSRRVFATGCAHQVNPLMPRAYTRHRRNSPRKKSLRCVPVADDNRLPVDGPERCPNVPDGLRQANVDRIGELAS